jgi:hypothetical protein
MKTSNLIGKLEFLVFVIKANDSLLKIKLVHPKLFQIKAVNELAIDWISFKLLMVARIAPIYKVL